ncbi:MAG: hypothetical protein HC786_28460 [Richelia sp. CSU_2_1]|nr:hypothetical protein [Richelia sp. CSU_2_1]
MTTPHLSLNGIPGTLWEIRRQENIHPYLGWRQAILTASELEKSLKRGNLVKNRLRIELEKKERALQLRKDNRLLYFIFSIPSKFFSFFNKNDKKESEYLEILAAEIEIDRDEFSSLEQLIFDTETELNAAKEEKLRIESLNPDMVGGDSEALRKNASAAFQRKLVRAIVVSAYSSRKMISEGAAEVIYDSACLPEVEREQFEEDVVQQLMKLLPPEPVQYLETANGGRNGASAG